jgi:hypothetical protein
MHAFVRNGAVTLRDHAARRMRALLIFRRSPRLQIVYLYIDINYLWRTPEIGEIGRLIVHQPNGSHVQPAKGGRASILAISRSTRDKGAYEPRN